MIVETFAMAIAEIRRNLLRSLLTTLGIVIGVAAVVAMVTLGQSATAKVTSDISSLGNNLLMVRPGAEERGPPSSSGTPFDDRDVKAMERAIRGLGQLSPFAGASVTLVAGNENHTTTVNGVSPAYFDIRAYEIDDGRAFTDAEASRAVCVVGPTVQDELFGSRKAVGETIRLGRVSCEVIGVLEAKGSGFGPDQDDVVLMPFHAFQSKLSGTDDVSMVYVGIADNHDIGRASERLTGALRETRGIQEGQADDFHVQDMREIAETFSSVTRILTAFLGAVGAISLLVGGIGIMNIMLVSVTERTREIGVRLAIGARPRDVLQQFLVESVVLSLAGGALGVVFGLGLSLVATTLLSLVWSPSPLVVAGAFAFCAVIGVGFGFLPARRAARLDPIQALRHE